MMDGKDGGFTHAFFGGKSEKCLEKIPGLLDFVDLDWVCKGEVDLEDLLATG